MSLNVSAYVVSCKYVYTIYRYWCTVTSCYRVDTNVEEGDIVHVIADFDEHNHCVITDTLGQLIVNPDVLISGTTVVSGLFCMRK